MIIICFNSNFKLDFKDIHSLVANFINYKNLKE